MQLLQEQSDNMTHLGTYSPFCWVIACYKTEWLEIYEGYRFWVTEGLLCYAKKFELVGKRGANS